MLLEWLRNAMRPPGSMTHPREAPLAVGRRGPLQHRPAKASVFGSNGSKRCKGRAVPPLSRTSCGPTGRRPSPQIWTVLQHTGPNHLEGPLGLPPGRHAGVVPAGLGRAGRSGLAPPLACGTAREWRCLSRGGSGSTRERRRLGDIGSSNTQGEGGVLAASAVPTPHKGKAVSYRAVGCWVGSGRRAPPRPS